MRSLHTVLFTLALVTASGGALAEPPAQAAPSADSKKSRPSPRRRAAKHDRARSEQVRGGRIHVMDDVRIVGRPQRPLSVLDTAARPFEFPVGTARYSPRDRAFLPVESAERW